MENSKFKRILKILSSNQGLIAAFTFVMIVCILLGTSYSIFSNESETGNTDVYLKSGELEVKVNSESNLVLSLNNLESIDAKPYEFTFQNSGDIDINYYEIKLVSEEFSDSFIPEKAIKYSYSLDNLNYTQYFSLGDSNNLLYVGENLKVNEQITIYIKLVIDNDYLDNANYKDYYGSIEMGLYQEFPKDYIKYDNNGGYGLINKTYIKDNITNYEPLKEGFRFIGWSKDKENVLYNKGDICNETSNTILYAVWEKDN